MQIQVEIFSDLTPRNEKWYIALIAAISGTAALIILLLLPSSIADFRVNSAAAGFKTAVNSGIANITKELSCQWLRAILLPDDVYPPYSG